MTPLIHSALTPLFATLPKNVALLECKHLPNVILENKSIEDLTNLLSFCDGALKNAYKNVKNITLLHLSALSNRTDLVRHLCPQPYNKALPKDEEENNPLHLRAMVSESNSFNNDPWVQEFLKHCTLKTTPKKTRNAQGLTPFELFQLAQSKERVLAKQTPTYIGLAPQKKDLSTTQFHRINSYLQVQEECLNSSFRFIEKIITTSKDLFNQWLLIPNVNAKPFHSLSERVKQDLRKLDLTIRRINLTSSNCGVFTNKEIPKGILMQYLGRFVTTRSRAEYLKYSQNSQSDYIFDISVSEHQSFIDAREFRNFVPFINDGPPMLAQTFKGSIGGIKSPVILKTLGIIPPNTQLLIDYGPNHSVKFSGDYEIDPVQFKYFEDVINRSFKNPEAFIKSDRMGKDSFTFMYMLNTPFVIFKLAELNILKPSDALNMWQLMYLNNSKDSLVTSLGVDCFPAQGSLLVAFMIGSVKEILDKQQRSGLFNKLMSNFYKNIKCMNTLHDDFKDQQLLRAFSHLISLKPILLAFYPILKNKSEEKILATFQNVFDNLLYNFKKEILGLHDVAKIFNNLIRDIVTLFNRKNVNP